jgi:hypothetical protein
MEKVRVMCQDAKFGTWARGSNRPRCLQPGDRLGIVAEGLQNLVIVFAQFGRRGPEPVLAGVGPECAGNQFISALPYFFRVRRVW